MQNHHVNKLIITSTTACESTGFDLRRQLKSNWHEILPDITESFDAACADNEFIYLPKLEISLNVNSMHLLVSDNTEAQNIDLKERIKAQVMQQVLDFKKQHNNSACEDSTQNKGIRSIDSTGNLKTINSDLLTWQDIKLYLQTGQLPWYIIQEELTTFSDSKNKTESLPALMRLIIKDNIIDCINDLYTNHCENKVTRLIQLCDSSLYKTIFYHVVTHSIFNMRYLKDIAAADVQQYSQALLIIIEALIARMTNPIPTTNLLLNKLTDNRFKTNVESSLNIQDLSLKGILTETANQLKLSEESLSTFLLSTTPLTNDEQNCATQDSKHKSTVNNTQSLDNAILDELFNEATPIFFAGSILLYPYLKRLFHELDYLSEDKKIKQTKYHKAISLMLYMVTGKQQAFDYQLHFIKWLLNISSSSLIHLEENLLTETEKETSNQVLLSLQAHWKVLKNTSLNTIRTNFLQRPGVMRLDGKQCQISIERMGIDVLIDQIPFSLSIIRLPWIKESIIVTW